MAPEYHVAFIRNIAEVPWREFPDHFGGALSKPLVMPETAGSKHLDYRISMYQPMAHVELHKHKVQEQVYHVLEGEGLMEIDGKNHVVRKHDFIFLPPGVEHSISNTGLVDLVFLVITSPVTDDEAQAEARAEKKGTMHLVHCVPIRHRVTSGANAHDAAPVDGASDGAAERKRLAR